LDLDLNTSPPGICERSRYYRWKVEWTNNELSEILKSAFPRKETGTIKDIQVIQRGNSGRIVVLKFITDKGEFEVKGDAIRRVMGFKSKWGAIQSLYSTRFKIYKKEENGEIKWTAEGSGWGHGVGMCQFGALGLAKKGASYEQILKKYYQGIEIVDYYKLPGLQ